MLGGGNRHCSTGRRRHHTRHRWESFYICTSSFYVTGFKFSIYLQNSWDVSLSSGSPKEMKICTELTRIYVNLGQSLLFSGEIL
jgi:hypothetical protein